MEEKVWAFIRSKALIQRGQKIGCALSGGADSVALFVCLQDLSRHHSFDLCAVHVHHGIRGAEADRDAAFVENLCADAGVPLHLFRKDVPAYAAGQGIGLELAARKVRRSCFASLHAAGALDAVATAHHRGDNAESLLLHLSRGSGLDGLAGIQPRQGFLIRPFLCLERNEIRSFLRRRGTKWVEDSTNDDTTYRRNYVRREILPRLEQMNPRAVEALNRLAISAAGDLDFIRQQAAATEAAAAIYNEGTAEIDLETLNAAHPAVSSRVLRLALGRLGRTEDVEQVHVESLLQLAKTARSGASLDLGGGIRAEVRYGTLHLGGQRKPIYFEQPLILDGTTVLPAGTMMAAPAAERLAGSAWSQYLDRDAIPEGAVLRTRRPGDVFYPLHAPGSRKLKEFFIDSKIPRSERDRVPLLAAGGRILWVVGHRLSQDVAVGERTKRIVHLTYAERTT